MQYSIALIWYIQTILQTNATSVCDTASKVLGCRSYVCLLSLILDIFMNTVAPLGGELERKPMRDNTPVYADIQRRRHWRERLEHTHTQTHAGATNYREQSIPGYYSRLAPRCNREPAQNCPTLSPRSSTRIRSVYSRVTNLPRCFCLRRQSRRGMATAQTYGSRSATSPGTRSKPNTKHLQPAVAGSLANSPVT